MKLTLLLSLQISLVYRACTKPEQEINEEELEIYFETSSR